jgi:hypothetical protein
VPRISSHGPVAIDGGSTITEDAPAQVVDRGRRRDGGSSFTIVHKAHNHVGAIMKLKKQDLNLIPAACRRI